MIRTLPRVIAEPAGKPVPEGNTDLQRLARQIATDPTAWTPELTALITDLFDRMAPVWDTEHATGRLDFLADALARGGPLPSGICLELGSGTGQHTPLLANAFDHVIAVDLARQMLTRAPARLGPRLQADAAHLPLADCSLTAVVCIDALLFPGEISRVLAADGVLIWANQLSADGPLFLDAATVITALDGAWNAVQAEAGWGSWVVLRRAVGPSGRPSPV
ncbi:class I SAM-dependent methyltransferase [Nonomuraea sp. NPDC049480]|uniref:class I SAM-dependent methyltransferase n=1 Tax=Nonomuraea sp. NPDC049480 TaxID=3364353 RepID=UPI0037AF5BCE